MIDKVLHGDCLNCCDLVEKRSVQLVFTSPPYPAHKCCDMSVSEWLAWFEPRVAAIVETMKENAVFALNVTFGRIDGRFDFRLYTDIPAILAGAGLIPIDLYIWNKLNPVPCGDFRKNDTPGYEPVFLFARSDDYFFYPVRTAYSGKSLGKLKEGNRTRAAGVDGSYVGGHNNAHPDGARQTNVLSISSSGDQHRPRAKNGSFPRGLVERFIRQHTVEGDLVLDPFCGVGTTCVSARQLGRRYVGIDINRAEVERAEEWLKAYDREYRSLFDE